MTEQNKNLNDDLSLAVNFEEENEEKKQKAKSQKTNESAKNQNSLSLTKTKIVIIKKLLQNIKENNDRLIRLFADLLGDQEEAVISIGQLADEKFELAEEQLTEGRIIEGVFDGENMIGPDGKQYNVPANYASKSKLVEGDILKLTITSNGTFIYKQIGPIERARVVGTLDRAATGEFYAMADNKKWRLLNASVTYFKGEAGDEVVILVPKTGESKWAAVENVVKKS